MPWKETSRVIERKAFVQRVLEGEVNMSALCREYGISRKTGYKWLDRYQAEGRAGLEDRSRRPHNSPKRTSREMEQVVLEARRAHPAWGGRKLKRWLERQGWQEVPAPSTITAILHRHDRIDPEQSAQRQPIQRFEKEQPNELWQMDVKGHFQLTTGPRCHPLTVLDDHSRFLVGLHACPDQTGRTVHAHLKNLFQRYGLPQRMLMDNGAPWGKNAQTPYTRLGVWLLRLDIRVSHGRPYHPQTQGKVERLHRSLRAEVLNPVGFASLAQCQRAFDDWRGVYNLQRPHEALELEPPVTRFEHSPRPFPDPLPPLRFPPSVVIRKVSRAGRITFHNQRYRVGKGFRGQRVGLLPDDLQDGLFHVYYNAIHVRSFEL